MIFVTVGSHEPFDRMVKAVDEWAATTGESVFIQTGPADYKPQHCEWTEFISFPEFLQNTKDADIIIAHAGMGTILTALECGKKIIVMPRHADKGETRSDHQIDSGKLFEELSGIAYAADENELRRLLDDKDSLNHPSELSRSASNELLTTVESFIKGEVLPDNSAKKYDGIICFGGIDWWYHNRGHYDIQMMREISEEIPVLYVNSIGMRAPSPGEGKMFFKRVVRKLKSFRRGLVKVRPNFGVYSPPSVPVINRKPIGARILAWQVKRAGRKMGMKNPLVWLACPPALRAIDYMKHSGFVYQRTDRTEEFKDVDLAAIKALDVEAKARADLSLFCSALLFDEEGPECKRPMYVDHGVDYGMFSSDNLIPPADARSIKKPNVGFVGGIDSHTFDPEFFLEVAKKLPEIPFVLTGGCSLPQDWCTLPNVHQLGQKDYSQVAAYMAASDVLIMPWNKSRWIEACNPVKLKEYLAVGRPIVTTNFYELKNYDGYVKVGTTPDEFAAAIKDALNNPPDKTFLRKRVEEHTWKNKAKSVIDKLSELGINFRK